MTPDKRMRPPRSSATQQPYYYVQSPLRPWAFLMRVGLGVQKRISIPPTIRNGQLGKSCYSVLIFSPTHAIDRSILLSSFQIRSVT